MTPVPTPEQIAAGQRSIERMFEEGGSYEVTETDGRNLAGCLIAILRDVARLQDDLKTLQMQFRAEAFDRHLNDDPDTTAGEEGDVTARETKPTPAALWERAGYLRAAYAAAADASAAASAAYAAAEASAAYVDTYDAYIDAAAAAACAYAAAADASAAYVDADAAAVDAYADYADYIDAYEAGKARWAREHPPSEGKP